MASRFLEKRIGEVRRGQVLTGTMESGSSCLSRDGFFQLCTCVAVKLEKSSGFSERDVVFASEVTQLVVLGFGNGAPVRCSNLLIVGHYLSSKKRDRKETR
jgi:hypothetical protein